MNWCLNTLIHIYFTWKIWQISSINIFPVTALSFHDRAVVHKFSATCLKYQKLHPWIRRFEIWVFQFNIPEKLLVLPMMINATTIPKRVKQLSLKITHILWKNCMGHIDATHQLIIENPDIPNESRTTWKIFYTLIIIYVLFSFWIKKIETKVFFPKHKTTPARN